MITYKYSALSHDGARVDGVINAIDEYAAVEKIKVNCPIVIEISEVKEKKSVLDIELGAKYDPKALSLMCSQFAIVLGSGVSIDLCLKMLAAQTKDKKLKKMLDLSAEDVAMGTPVATAFEKNYPDLPVTFVETVRAGEISGTLEQSFQSLAEFYEREYNFKTKVKQATSYPKFVLLVAIIVLIVVMGFVMPKFLSMFDSLGAEVPLITKILIAITGFFQRWWILLLGIIILLYVLFKYYTHTENGRMNWAKQVLKFPVLGNLNALQGSTEFSSTMATLVKAGLPVEEALDVTSKVMTNYAMSTEIKGMSERIKTGTELGDTMRKSEYFPQVLKEMTAVGEKTGELGSTLETVSRYYANEYNNAVSSALAKLEPTMLVFLAIFAGFIVIALYLPMFTMYNAM